MLDAINVKEESHALSVIVQTPKDSSSFQRSIELSIHTALSIEAMHARIRPTADIKIAHNHTSVIDSLRHCVLRASYVKSNDVAQSITYKPMPGRSQNVYVLPDNHAQIVNPVSFGSKPVWIDHVELSESADRIPHKSVCSALVIKASGNHAGVVDGKRIIQTAACRASAREINIRKKPRSIHKGMCRLLGVRSSDNVPCIVDARDIGERNRIVLPRRVNRNEREGGPKAARRGQR